MNKTLIAACAAGLVLSLSLAGCKPESSRCSTGLASPAVTHASPRGTLRRLTCTSNELADPEAAELPPRGPVQRVLASVFAVRNRRRRTPAEAVEALEG